MRRTPSPWWYALPAAIALVSVVAGGLVIGYQLGAAGRVAVAEIDEIETVPSTGLRITFEAGENRTLFGSAPGPEALWSDVMQQGTCEITANVGQTPPQVTFMAPRQRDGATLEVNGVRWYAWYEIHAVDGGQLLISCAPAGARFALGPWLDPNDYAGFGVAGVVALAATTLGLLVALTLAGVLLVLSLTRQPATVPPSESSGSGIATPLA